MNRVHNTGAKRLNAINARGVECKVNSYVVGPPLGVDGAETAHWRGFLLGCTGVAEIREELGCRFNAADRLKWRETNS